VCIDIFNTGHHQAAVFEAFRILEVAIREAAGYGPNEHGESTINDAFNEKTGGPLVDAAAPKSEQRAMRFMMVGSNGLFRNPRGHKGLDDPKEAAELLSWQVTYCDWLKHGARRRNREGFIADSTSMYGVADEPKLHLSRPKPSRRREVGGRHAASS
jgi:uncharacterized protein (TIGR02391 family)